MVDLRRIITPVVNLLRSPDGLLDRQMLFGDEFVVEVINDGWAKGMRQSDSYAGYVEASHLAGSSDVTARVRDMGAHVYPAPDIKTVPLLSLPFQAELTVVDEQGDFVELAGGGFVHNMQIEPIAVLEIDFVQTALKYLGVPYLWGGNSQYGIDCSGLVSAAMRSSGIPCAGDSGVQAKTLGSSIPVGTPLARGDAIFWDGHVGLMVDETTLVHANGYHMKVIIEPLSDAVTRIASLGSGDITAQRRV